MGDEAKPGDGTTEVSNRSVRWVIVLACICGCLFSTITESRWAPAFYVATGSALLFALLWSIRDRLLEIRDRLPAPKSPPPAPSAQPAPQANDA